LLDNISQQSRSRRYWWGLKFGGLSLPFNYYQTESEVVAKQAGGKCGEPRKVAYRPFIWTDDCAGAFAALKRATSGIEIRRRGLLSDVGVCFPTSGFAFRRRGLLSDVGFCFRTSGFDFRPPKCKPDLIDDQLATHQLQHLQSSTCRGLVIASTITDSAMCWERRLVLLSSGGLWCRESKENKPPTKHLAY
jgi:hypothetical protein